MKALTVRQPFAHAIIRLDKDVENHSYPVNYRGPLLIHAGFYKERYPREVLAEYMKRPPSEAELSDLPRGCIIGAVYLEDCVRNAKSRWADRGMWHWKLACPRPMRPVECKGWLRLWTPPRAVINKLPSWVRELETKSIVR